MAVNEKRPVIAVDIGGTSIRIALVSSDGVIRDRYHTATSAAEGPPVVSGKLYYGIEALFKKNRLSSVQVHAVSIAFAGIIDMKRGMVTAAPHLPGWEDFPLKDTVEDRFGITACVLNDADAAVLGEHRFGAGKGCSEVVLLTLGTGIGGGVITGGRLLTGSVVSAAEPGHMILESDGPACFCGRNGCFETLVSGTAIERAARERLAGGESSLLTGITNGHPEDVTAEMVHRAAIEGDALSLRVIEQAAYYLGIGLLNIVAIFSPEMIIIGGSVAEMGELLLGPARNMVSEKSFPAMAENVKIVRAQLGNDAGMIGAAVYAYR